MLPGCPACGVPETCQVLLNEEREHHRYTVRDLGVLDPAGASGS